MHCVRSIWGTFGYGLGGNAISGTPGDSLKKESGDRLISTLKRDALLFDSIYVVPIEFTSVIDKLDDRNRDELLMLKDKAIISFYHEWSDPPKVCGDTLAYESTPLQRTSQQLFDLFCIVQASLIAMSVGSREINFYDDHESRRFRQNVLDFMHRMGLEEACNMYFDLGQLVHDFQSRFHAQYLQRNQSLDIVPVLNKSEPISRYVKLSSEEVDKGENNEKFLKSDIANVCLEMIPFPDLTTSWETLLAYRSDDEVKKNYLALRRWMRKAASQFTDPGELRDEIEYLILERESQLKFHDLKINSGTIETVLTIGAEVVESVARLKLSTAIKALFTFNHRKIQLLEAERNAPGREIAYISDARKAFGKTRRSSAKR